MAIVSPQSVPNALPASLDVALEAPVGRLQLAPSGAELARAREARALTVRDVADRLLLSTRQVRALESADVRAFHNAEFYRRAHTKYEAWLGLGAPLGVPLAAPRPCPIPEPLRLTLAESGPGLAVAPAASASRARLLLVAVVVLAVISAYALGLP
jgi:cytoskeleton protein RodZ